MKLKSEQIINDTISNKLVGKMQLLAVLFDDKSRPSLRWLNYQIAAGEIPYIKIGAKVFFDPEQVRAKLIRKNTVGNI